MINEIITFISIYRYKSRYTGIYRLGFWGQNLQPPKIKSVYIIRWALEEQKFHMKAAGFWEDNDDDWMFINFYTICVIGVRPTWLAPVPVVGKKHYPNIIDARPVWLVSVRLPDWLLCWCHIKKYDLNAINARTAWLAPVSVPHKKSDQNAIFVAFDEIPPLWLAPRACPLFLLCYLSHHWNLEAATREYTTNSKWWE